MRRLSRYVLPLFAALALTFSGSALIGGSAATRLGPIDQASAAAMPFSPPSEVGRRRPQSASDAAAGRSAAKPLAEAGPSSIPLEYLIGGSALLAILLIGIGRILTQRTWNSVIGKTSEQARRPVARPDPRPASAAPGGAPPSNPVPHPRSTAPPAMHPSAPPPPPVAWSAGGRPTYPPIPLPQSRPQPGASWPASTPSPSPWPTAATPAELDQPTLFASSPNQPVAPDFPMGFQIVGPPRNGGMASVYKAYQPYLDRYVALKIMTPALASDPEFVQRFYEEARRMAKLEHPNIVPIYDIGQAPSGPLYIAMRFIDGLTMQELLARERILEAGRAVHIASEVAEALDYAHTQGIVHRDVKPSNIMVEAGDRITLMDFGIAKAIGESQLTRPGAIVGTPKYLSPEQALGQPAEPRSDIYALGTVLFEALTGHAPFETESAPALLHAHTTLPPPSPMSLNPAIPRMLETVILRALSKDPTARYPRASEFRRAMSEAIASGSPLAE